MTDRQIQLHDNYMRVLENIENAKARRGAGPEVTLLAASKMNPASDVVFLAKNCGLRLCGENHAQEFNEKYEAVAEAGVAMDFIGHLQTNKVRYVAGRAGLIHSLDSVKLAAELDRRCGKLGIKQGVLVELNVGSEESKTGLSPERLSEYMGLVGEYHNLEVRGLMVMAPKSTEKSEIRKYFRESYRIFLDFFDKNTHNIGEPFSPILSMGMSDSYECAIEEGSTMVRVGSAIFGSRNYI